MISALFLVLFKHGDIRERKNSKIIFVLENKNQNYATLRSQNVIVELSVDCVDRLE